MCGIVGGITQRNVTEILLEGLYRGYDSAWLAIINMQNQLHRIRCVGKVKTLKCMCYPLR